jgi:Icc protein
VAEIDGVDGRPTVVAIHHPPLSPSTHEMFQLDGAGQLLTALEARPHIRAVLSGHLHEPFEYVAGGGLQLLGAPSTYTPIDHRDDTYVVPGTCATGARVLHLDDDGTLSSELLVA